MDIGLAHSGNVYAGKFLIKYISRAKHLHAYSIFKLRFTVFKLVQVSFLIFNNRYVWFQFDRWWNVKKGGR